MEINYELFSQLKEKFKLSDKDAKELTDAISSVSKDVVETEYRSILRKDLELLETRLKGEIKTYVFGTGLAQLIVIIGSLFAILGFILNHLIKT